MRRLFAHAGFVAVPFAGAWVAAGLWRDWESAGDWTLGLAIVACLAITVGIAFGGGGSFIPMGGTPTGDASTAAAHAGAMYNEPPDRTVRRWQLLSAGLALDGFVALLGALIAGRWVL